MARINKYLYGWAIWSNYGYGWEIESFYDKKESTLQNVKDDLVEYRKSGHGASYKLSSHREKNPFYLHQPHTK